MLRHALFSDQPNRQSLTIDWAAMRMRDKLKAESDEVPEEKQVRKIFSDWIGLQNGQLREIDIWNLREDTCENPMEFAPAPHWRGRADVQ